MPPRDRENEQPKLDEQDFAWWTKQLGREPTQSDRETAPSRPEDHGESSSTRSHELREQRATSARWSEAELSDALRQADEADATEKREQADAARESLLRIANRSTAAAASPSPAATDVDARSDAGTDGWRRAWMPESRLWKERTTDPPRASGAAMLLGGLRILSYSPHRPYPAMRRAAGYTIMFIFAALIGWLLALLH